MCGNYLLHVRFVLGELDAPCLPVGVIGLSLAFIVDKRPKIGENRGRLAIKQSGNEVGAKVRVCCAFLLTIDRRGLQLTRMLKSDHVYLYSLHGRSLRLGV